MHDSVGSVGRSRYCYREEGVVRVRRAPSPLCKPTEKAYKRFFKERYTRKVLYPDRFVGESPADEVQYLADHVNGRPQHSCGRSKCPGYGGSYKPLLTVAAGPNSLGPA